MAGLTMYAMKPVFELDAALEIPSCMYSLPVIQSSVSIPGVSDTGSCPPGALQALEARQDTILARLERLKAEVAAYKKSLGLSGSEVASTTSQVTFLELLTIQKLKLTHTGTDNNISQLSFPSIAPSDSTLQRLSKLRSSIAIIEAIFSEKPSSNQRIVTGPKSNAV